MPILNLALAISLIVLTFSLIGSQSDTHYLKGVAKQLATNDTERRDNAGRTNLVHF